MATPNATGNCPAAMKATSNGAFQNENPLDYALPLIILQICLVVVFTRLLAYLLKPLKQPRVIAEIIGGILLGPTALGRSKVYLDTIFPEKSMTVLDTLANIGLLFFLFLVGLELDFAAIRKTGKKSLLIALAGISLPFVIGVGASFILSSTISKGVHQLPFIVFMGVALSITAFPVLARILAELKLLTTDVGRMAMSAAGVNDIAAWIFLALAIALSGNDSSSLVPLWVLLSGSGFVIFAILVIKPILGFMAKRCPEGEPVKELYVCVTLTLVLAASFLTDTIGIHALFGAFVVGIVTPKQGPFCRILTEKIEDLVSGLLLPLYFASSGLKTDVTTIRGAQSWGLLVLVILTTCFGKIVGTVGASMLCKVPFREAMALGVLMNTKGLVELIVLNIGKDRKVLNDQVFAILVLMALVTTFITTPLLLAIYKPARKGAPYKHRTIQRKDHDSELRILACFHSTRNIPTLINMIESSRGTGLKGRLCVYAMHLMELSERSSAIAMVHKARYNGLPIWNKIERSTDQMVIAFEGYQHLRAVAVRPMTAISDLSTIHEDICTSAHQKRVAMILLPFHKHQRMDGAMESIGHAFHEVNKRVLQQAPCSVGILVDRGLGGASHVVASEVDYKIVVPFFGGLDDREALAYGMKMVEHPGITLTILKFVASRGTLKRFEKEIDEDFSLAYEERVVESKEDVRATLKATSKCNLFVVGRNAAVVPLVNSTDCPELGPVGRLLSSSEFSTTASVLVVQGYDSAADTRPVVEDDDYEQSSREIGDSTV
ncbi:BnaCnng62230D [Brassica napus]|uniref:BnaCnng62230D protein n=1 Tax=Brassica napus TaxID=3708 RepID=A0A078JRX1_BRANA|nr:BnaCnng62230D [Brassica napus]